MMDNMDMHEPMEVKRQEYAVKVDAAQHLRGQAKALSLARQARANLKTWKASNRAGTELEIERKAMLGRTVAEVVDFFDNQGSSALEQICEDNFKLVYQIYYDIDRPAVLGMNTMTCNIPVCWEKLDIDVGLYAGPLQHVAASEKMVAAAREGIPNRDEVSKCTGWSRDDVRRVPDNAMQTLKVLMKQATVGQDKLTRLVKGYLLLLECMGRGKIEMVAKSRNTIVYGPDAVINSYRMEGRAYVFNSKPESAAHSCILFRMCEEYPPAEFNSHIHIPADGESVFMVSQGQAPPNDIPVILNPNMIHASLLTYALDCNLTEFLQPALLIACSLQENRYFCKVKLPKVASTYDLMAPAYISRNSQLNKPIISLELAKSLGRLHQMLGFVTARDIISAAEMTSKSGYSPMTTILNYFKSSNSLISRMAEHIGPLALLQVTKQLQIFEWLTAEDVEDMVGISVMESLWLATTARRVVHNGVLAAILDGEKDMSGIPGTYEVLKKEVQMAGVHIENEKLPPPTGSFTVGWVGVVPEQRVRPPRKVATKIFNIKLSHDCDYKPSTKVKRKVRDRFRGKRDNKHREKEEVVNIRDEQPVDEGSPPPYTEPSEPSSSDTESEGSSKIIGSDEQQPSSGSPKSDGDEYRATRLAHEAKAVKTRVSFEPLAEILDSRSRAHIEEAARLKTSQLSFEESVRHLLRRGQLSRDEQGEWLGLIGRKLSYRRADALGTISKITGALCDVKLDDEKLLSGDNKYTRRVNKAIEQWNISIVVSDYGQARKDKSGWEGDVDKLDTRAFRFIVNSGSWRRWLQDQDIDPDEPLASDASGTMVPARIVMSELLSRATKLSARDAYNAYLWLRDCGINIMPVDIESAALEAPVEKLQWRIEPGSLSSRTESIEDSRWLILAGYAGQCGFDKQRLGKLCSLYDVPVDIRTQLRNKYDLFKRI